MYSLGAPGIIGITVGFFFALFTIYGIKEGINHLGEKVNDTFHHSKRRDSEIQEYTRAIAQTKYRSVLKLNTEKENCDSKFAGLLSRAFWMKLTIRFLDCRSEPMRC